VIGRILKHQIYRASEPVALMNVFSFLSNPFSAEVILSRLIGKILKHQL
jgi:hypothetical protein